MSEVNKKLGALLKKERERQSIKIEDLSERLKISIPNLQAIENGTSDAQPVYMLHPGRTTSGLMLGGYITLCI